eukprot:Rhum_TRINITY_DN17546_c0_g1::Rhum_TRINITY_DN17546_c0_g1_i1::g.166169::m.166169
MNLAALQGVGVSAIRGCALRTNVLSGIALPSEGAGVREKAEYARQDKRDDTDFYKQARFETHMSDEMITQLRAFYASQLDQSAAAHIDFCSSFSCHFPESYAPARCVTMGLNGAELDANTHATERVVQNLNKVKELPFDDASFDAATNVASVEYLSAPLRHFAEARRVLRPDAPYYVSFTTRAFWTKATKIWTQLSHEQRMVLVASYLTASGFHDVEAWHLIAPGAEGDNTVEPLAVVFGRA